MDRLLARLERRFGRYAIENLTWYLVGFQALVFAVAYVRPEVIGMLRLDADLVLRGQVHRLVTWLFIPVSTSPIWVLFALYWLYTMGTALEAHWGTFRYQAYWMMGALGTVIAGFAIGRPVDNVYLVMSLFLAFATLWPDYTILAFLILPVRVKWLALLDAALLLERVGTLPGWERLVPIISIANYLLFFGRPLIDAIGRQSHQARRAGEFRRFKARMAEGRRAHACALCGVTDADPNTEFRICDCAKCGKATEYCLPHALNH